MQDDPFKIKKIKFLLYIYEYRAIAKAGEIVNFTPPAASHCLEEMRNYFGDPLFVVNKKQTLPTARFLELLPALRMMAEASESFSSSSFNIGSVTNRFRFSCSPAFASSLLDFLLPRMMKEAPRASLEHISLTSHPLSSLMNGEVDLLLGRAVGLPATAHAHIIRAGRRVVLLRKDHPLISLHQSRPLLRDDLKNYRRISLSSGRKQDWKGPDHGVFSETEDRSGVLLRTDRPQDAWKSLCTSNLIMVCTERSAGVATDLHKDLAFIPLPQDANSPNTPQMAILWSELTHRDPAHTWFRNLVLEWDRKWEDEHPEDC
jgi:DNA-binding transcriptional LysR family regulator